MNITERQNRMLSFDRGIRRCRKCPLQKRRKHAVPGEGPVTAGIFFLGEAPGAQEDEAGRPFVGRSGIFFNTLLAGAGINRQDAFITSTVKCRPPNNRRPKPMEMAICRKNWLDNQIELINPPLVVLLGQTACQLMLNEKKPLNSLHGKLYHTANRNLFVTFHPAAAMRFPLVRRKMKKDLKIVKKLLRSINV